MSGLLGAGEGGGDQTKELPFYLGDSGKPLKVLKQVRKIVQLCVLKAEGGQMH